MRSLWQRWRDPLGLYARLEARRSRARPDFVRQLADELGETRRTTRTPLRLVLVGALTLMTLAAAGTVGAAGYAGSALLNAASAVAKVSGNQNAALADDDDDDGGDPDDDQYEEEREECEEAVEAAHDDFHAGLTANHRLFHQQGGGAGAHRSFHRGQENAHRAQHRLYAVALDECDAIGGGRRDDDDD